MKAKVIKILQDNDIDISKLRIIQHGNWVDIYPKVPQCYEYVNKRKSRRKDKTKEVINCGNGIKEIPVTEGIHSTKKAICYAMISEFMLNDELDVKIFIAGVKNGLESVVK